MKTWHAHNHVRWRSIEDAIVILDLHHGHYFVLDRVASAIWSDLLSGVDSAELTGRLSHEYAVPAEHVANDIAAFVSELQSRNFLTDQAPDRPQGMTSRPTREPSLLALRAWWHLFAASHRLKRQGFGPTYTMYSTLTRPMPVADWQPRLERALCAFARAENFYHLKQAPEDCLPRSLALFRFLASIGIAADHVIGVQRFPFAAHAWIECNGRVVQDDADRPRCYTEIARITASAHDSMRSRTQKVGHLTRQKGKRNE